MGECLLGRIACWIAKSYLKDVNGRKHRFPSMSAAWIQSPARRWRSATSVPPVLHIS